MFLQKSRQIGEEMLSFEEKSTSGRWNGEKVPPNFPVLLSEEASLRSHYNRLIFQYVFENDTIRVH